MTTKDIEELATNAVKKSVLTSGYLSQYISENDKGPSWDGFIYIYNNEQKRKTDYYGRVAVQIKGSCQKDHSAQTIVHRADIDDLKSYQKDGGVFYFVVYISPNGEAETIYYAALSRSKLNTLLSKCKSGQRSKKIQLTLFPQDKNERVSIIKKFYDNCEKEKSTATPIQTTVDINPAHQIKRPFSPMVSRYLNKHIYENFGRLIKKDMYMPCDYSYENQPIHYNNILNPISAFLSGSLKNYLETKGIVLQRDSGQAEEKRTLDPDLFTAIVVEGNQCTGKSTIIAQIINQMDTRQLPWQHFFLLSFSDNRLKENPMSCDGICNYLDIQETELDKNTLLLIDAIDESDWSQQDATRRIANLVNELSALHCKIIITSRSGYLNINSNDKRFLNIKLHRFTEQQALEWVSKYRQAFPAQNTTKIEDYIKHVSQLKQSNEITKRELNLINTADVILMPHIMMLCIQYQVNIKNINNLAHLYRQVFLPNADNNFLLNQYSVCPNYLTLEDAENIFCAAVKVAIHCMSHPENIVSEKDLSESINNDQMVSVICTRFLLTKVHNGYSFAHQSIPAFLIAHQIYALFCKTEHQMSDELLLNEISHIVSTKGVLTELVQEYMHYLVLDGNQHCSQRIARILSSFLKGEIPLPNMTTNILENEKHQMMWCDGLIRLYAALNVPKFDKVIGVSFFQQYDTEERKRLVHLLSNPNGQASKSLGFCQLQDMELDYINLKGTNLRGRYIHRMKMHKAHLDECSLSGAYIIDCDLSLSCFDNTKSKTVQFYNSILCGCSFKNATLNGSIFTNCNLANADIRGAEVFKLKFENCILGGMKMDLHQLKDLLGMDPSYIYQQQILVYLGDELLLGSRLEEEYQRILPVHSLLVPNRIP